MRAVRNAIAAGMLAGAGAATGADGEAWRTIWFKVPLEKNGSVDTGRLLRTAHQICQRLESRHYESGSSRLGRTGHNPLAESGREREVRAACTQDKEDPKEPESTR